MRNKYINAVRKAKTTHVRQLALSRKGGVWSILKRNSKSHAKQVNVISPSGDLTRSDLETANVFKTVFQSKVNSLKKTAKPQALIDVLPDYKDKWDLITRGLKIVRINFICIMAAYLHLFASWQLICTICILHGFFAFYMVLCIIFPFWVFLSSHFVVYLYYFPFKSTLPQTHLLYCP